MTPNLTKNKTKPKTKKLYKLESIFLCNIKEKLQKKIKMLIELIIKNISKKCLMFATKFSPRATRS